MIIVFSYDDQHHHNSQFRFQYVSLLEYCYKIVLSLNLAQWLVVCVKDRIVRMAALLIIIIIILILIIHILMMIIIIMMMR